VVPDQSPDPGTIALATSTSDDGLSITTDKDDYTPGDTVWFTGAGWQAGGHAGHRAGGRAAACTTLIVDRTPPAISNFNISPNPVAVNTPFTISATFTDLLTNVTGAEYSLGGTGGPWVTLPNAGGELRLQDRERLDHVQPAERRRARCLRAKHRSGR